MRPFFQGSVDTFCAAYAVLNALQITHGINSKQGRELFTKLVLALSKDTTVFMRVLNLKTNYIAMTDAFLEICAKEYPILIRKPFELSEKTNLENKDAFWQILKDSLNPDKHKTAVFQFEKRREVSGSVFAHWTTGWEMTDSELILFDSSPEAAAITRLDPKKIHFQSIKNIDGEYIYINTKTLRLIEKTKKIKR